MPDTINVELPSAIENLTLPDPSLVNYYKLDEQRIIFIQGEIDETLLEYAKSIMLWSLADDAKGIPVDDRQPIYIFINTLGGDDFFTWALLDAIELSSTKVVTVNFGMALSNGLTLLCAGDERWAFPHSTALYHAGSMTLSGEKNTVSQANKYLEYMDKVYCEWILSKTAIDPKLLAKKTKQGDWYFSTDEQKSYGIVGGIAHSFSEIFAGRGCSNV